MKREDLCKFVVFGMLVIVQCSLALADGLQISQVYYDPVVTESGGEAGTKALQDQD